VVVLVVAALTFGGSSGGLREESTPRLRLVLSSTEPEHRALALSTTSIYAKNDPWKLYLASERVCPGGDESHLSESRRVAVLACLVNFARAREGLVPLESRHLLNTAAVKKARAILRCVTFAHNPCGGDWRAAIRSSGYSGVVGENLYIAGGQWGAPRVAMDAWLNSAEHRKNLFGRKWRDQGIAVLSAPVFGPYRDVALWVNVLAVPD
jgi:uncharacterized protein YkwD